MDHVIPLRREEDAPFCQTAWGWKYHHTGIPVQEGLPGAVHIPHLGLRVRGFPQSPLVSNTWPLRRILLCRPFCGKNRLRLFVLTHPGRALEQALSLPGTSLLTPPDSPAEGIEVVMILQDGFPVELIAFSER